MQAWRHGGKVPWLHHSTAGLSVLNQTSQRDQQQVQLSGVVPAPGKHEFLCADFGLTAVKNEPGKHKSANKNDSQGFRYR